MLRKGIFQDGVSGSIVVVRHCNGDEMKVQDMLSEKYSIDNLFLSGWMFNFLPGHHSHPPPNVTLVKIKRPAIQKQLLKRICQLNIFFASIVLIFHFTAMSYYRRGATDTTLKTPLVKIKCPITRRWLPKQDVNTTFQSQNGLNFHILE